MARRALVLAAGAVRRSALVADARARTRASACERERGLPSEATAPEMRRPLLDGEVGDGDDGGSREMILS